MTKKVFISILVSILLSLCTGFCFAATDTNNINLGNEVSSSIDKTMNTVGNVTRDVRNMGSYNITRTSTDTPAMTTGISTTTWIWVIFAMAAIIIIAAIWYYAMQSNDRS